MAAANAWTFTEDINLWTSGSPGARDTWNPEEVSLFRGIVSGTLTYWTTSGGTPGTTGAPSGATDVVKVKLP